MARTDNLKNYLTDIATAIKEKRNIDTVINGSQFDEEIKKIETGIKINGIIKNYTVNSIAPINTGDFVEATNEVKIEATKNNITSSHYSGEYGKYLFRLTDNKFIYINQYNYRADSCIFTINGSTITKSSGPYIGSSDVDFRGENPWGVVRVNDTKLIFYGESSYDRGTYPLCYIADLDLTNNTIKLGNKIQLSTSDVTGLCMASLGNDKVIYIMHTDSTTPYIYIADVIGTELKNQKSISISGLSIPELKNNAYTFRLIPLLNNQYLLYYATSGLVLTLLTYNPNNQTFSITIPTTTLTSVCYTSPAECVYFNMLDNSRFICTCSYPSDGVYAIAGKISNNKFIIGDKISIKKYDDYYGGGQIPLGGSAKISENTAVVLHAKTSFAQGDLSATILTYIDGEKPSIATGVEISISSEKRSAYYAVAEYLSDGKVAIGYTHPQGTSYEYYDVSILSVKDIVTTYTGKSKKIDGVANEAKNQNETIGIWVPDV